jgi:hypothetical protein
VHKFIGNKICPNKTKGLIEASYRKKFSTNVKNVRNDEKNTVFEEKSKKIFGCFLALLQQKTLKMAKSKHKNVSIFPRKQYFFHRFEYFTFVKYLASIGPLNKK